VADAAGVGVMAALSALATADMMVPALLPPRPEKLKALWGGTWASSWPALTEQAITHAPSPPAPSRQSRCKQTARIVRGRGVCIRPALLQENTPYPYARSDTKGTAVFYIPGAARAAALSLRLPDETCLHDAQGAGGRLRSRAHRASGLRALPPHAAVSRRYP
jgi:hypothetical protein